MQQRRYANLNGSVHSSANGYDSGIRGFANTNDGAGSDRSA